MLQLNDFHRFHLPQGVGKWGVDRKVCLYYKPELLMRGIWLSGASPVNLSHPVIPASARMLLQKGHPCTESETTVTADHADNPGKSA